MGDAANGGAGFSMDPEGLHGTGRRISARSTDAGGSAKRMKDGLRGASETVGNRQVKRALEDFVSFNIAHPAEGLPGFIDSSGNRVGRTAATARDEDNTKAGETRNRIVDIGTLNHRVNPGSR